MGAYILMCLFVCLFRLILHDPWCVDTELLETKAWGLRFQTVRQEHAYLLCIPSSPNFYWPSHRQVHCDSVVTGRGLVRFRCSHCSYKHLLSTPALSPDVQACLVGSCEGDLENERQSSSP